MEICQFEVYIQKDSFFLHNIDKMAEWLRRRTVNPLGIARVGSCPIFVVFLFGCMVKGIAICSLYSAIKVQISEKRLLSLKPHQPPSLKFRKNKITEQRATSSAMFKMAS